ncbi:MAG: dihydrolipoyl dehydrogenase [Acetobacteraceae bacterium]|nr:dihydrolipoyl dehydrogenase [Acetobacteraceae bacterium]
MYDLVVVGSGPGGYVAAIRAAHRGAKVALVEKAQIGGTCLNRGCIPTKALVRSAEIYGNVRRAQEFGVRVEGVGFDFGRVMARKRQVVQRLVGGVEYLLKANGVEVFRGKARVPRPGLVEVELPDGTAPLETRNVILATGSAHALPPLPPESIALCISSDQALELDRPPESLVVIGGGVLGVEFACIYAAFGARAQIVKRTPLVLPPMDDEISQRIAPLLKKANITVTSGVFVKRVEKTSAGLVLLADLKEGGEARFEGEAILIAMGRVPDFGGIDLDALGVAYDRRGIKVDARMRTSVPGIYAVGDVVGRYYLASVASAEGIAAVDDICGHGRDMDYAAVPQCVFSSPEAAGVGLKEREARERGIELVVSRFPYAANGKALALGETDGLVKVVAKAQDRKLLGVHLLGARATDLIHEAALAIKLGATAHDLAALIHAHPTLSETIMEAAHGASHLSIHQAPPRRG